jgi:hypothetical protein
MLSEVLEDLTEAISTYDSSEILYLSQGATSYKTAILDGLRCEGCGKNIQQLTRCYDNGVTVRQLLASLLSLAGSIMIRLSTCVFHLFLAPQECDAGEFHIRHISDVVTVPCSCMIYILTRLACARFVRNNPQDTPSVTTKCSKDGVKQRSYACNFLL